MYLLSAGRLRNHSGNEPPPGSATLQKRPGCARELRERDCNCSIHVGVNVGDDHRFAPAGQGCLNQAALIDTAARTIVVINANADGSGRVGAACGVLPSFELNGLLQGPAQTEAPG